MSYHIRFVKSDRFFSINSNMEAEQTDTLPEILTISEWTNAIDNNLDLYNLPEEKLRNSVRIGVPEKIRGAIWGFLSRSSSLSKNFSMSTYYKLTGESEFDAWIDKDLNRTFPSNPYFASRLG
jgi:hypothetical protein